MNVESSLMSIVSKLTPDVDQNQIAFRLSKAIFSYKKSLLAGIALAFSLCLPGLHQLTFSNDYRIFFSQDNPELNDFNHFQNLFGRSDSITMVIHNPSGTLLNADIGPDLEWLVDEAQSIKYVTRVEALTNAQNIVADDDELTIQPLLENTYLLDNDEYLEKQKIALKNPFIRGSLLSDSADTTAINIVFNLPQKSPFEVLEAAQAARLLQKRFSDLQPELKSAVSGIVMLNAAFSEAGISDIFSLLPIVFIVLFILLAAILRSLYATAIIFVCITGSCLFSMAIAGWLSIPITVVSVSSLIIIMTLAVANSMHLLVTMLNNLNINADTDKTQAITASIHTNLLPITLTSLTTIISFLTLNFSDAPPYWHLGNITALGVFAAWFLSFSLLPLLMLMIPRKSKANENSQKQQQRMAKISLWVIRHYRPVLFIGLIVTGGLISAVPKLVFNDQFIEYFSHNISFRRDTEFMQQHLSGLYHVEYVIDAKQTQGIFTSTYMHAVEDYTNWLKQQKEVQHVYSYSDLLKQLNQLLHGNDSFWYQLPEDEDTAAQQFLLYEFSLDADADIENRISLDKSSTRLTVITENLSSIEMQAFVERAAVWQQNHWPEDMLSAATGPAVMFAYISQRNIDSMVSGNIIALLAISAILLLLLRNVSLGVISFFANSLPILMMFGLWTLIVGEVGMVGTTIAAATLGIVVDDTIHFLSKFLYAKQKLNLSTAAAIEYTFSTVGVAIVSTTVVLVGGLSVLILSDFQLNQQAGLLTVITIILALLFDFLILPAALLMTASKDEYKAQMLVNS